ncbi:hypothetical protein [Chitinophaga sp. sic0106]|uniref:hypothetical protein n=1 Tax=Chitinophaga sp. sic0106 TaxID=2854785 RepID=UPI001C48A00C|nr:hypothetical protein [Chitinophaga sp. sic0106]MBV7528713.1 hypothetical protein [Chitinophaga sp. sic0106]
MKRAIGIFLLTLMVSQFLPIKEVGKILFNNQIVEEHPVEGGDHLKLAKELKFCHHADDLLRGNLLLEVKLNRFHSNEDIPSSPAQEIHCPPPNGILA